MNTIRSVARKEFNSFFSSPAAWLFLGGFLVISLFIFFWAEAFFARNIADMKPLFQWVPVLLIFLVAALTMRSWSEERRAGTLENLITSPVQPLKLILGKFIAALALVTLALLLTVPLPVTISLIGPLDWGPVIGGYVASLFLAAAYIAIGLYMSARTDNPIVALILTVATTGVFYLIGSPVLTTLFGHQVGGTLALLGSGSRFDAITRGVLDVRDLYYYLSIVGIFLTLNLLSLEKLRWAGNPAQARHRQWGWLAGLAIANFILGNLWLNPVGWARMDLTEGNIYSLSPATKQYLQQLKEPLLIRGYFSAKSHPLLEPLVPQIKDILKEYQVAGGDRVQVEFVDPHSDPALEQEAAEKYAIRPVPFRMASRYQSGVVNSYFNLLIAYGDQYETLSFPDLIEVKENNGQSLEVLLKNPEYAITRAVHKITNAYQAGGNVFANLQKPVHFHAYVSGGNQLPEVLADLEKGLRETLGELQESAGDKLTVDFADPDAGDGKLAERLQQDYGFSPQIASLLDPRPFWFYMVLASDGETEQVPLPAELDKAGLKQSIEAAVKRLAPGYLKTVALVKPTQAPANPYLPAAGGKRYDSLRKALSENVRVTETDLKSGQVPTDVDMLLLMSPENLDDKQLFAVDQFLMQGGSVLIASSLYDVSIGNSLEVSKKSSGLADWLQHNGIRIEDSMVLDPENAALPVPVNRQLGPITVKEIQMMPYPHFPDIRGDGLNDSNPMTASLNQLTLNWVSPIAVDKEKNQDRRVSELMQTSAESWTSGDLNAVPDYTRYPKTGFQPGQEHGPQLVAVAVQGRFESWFKDKPSPLMQQEAASGTDKKATAAKGDSTPIAASDKHSNDTQAIGSVINRSSDSARLILVASNSLASDNTLALASQGEGSLYTKPLEFMQNAVDWSLDNQGLMSIRGRARFARLLEPMQHTRQLFWEYLNYGLALVGLFAVWLWRRVRLQRRQAHYQTILAEV